MGSPLFYCLLSLEGKYLHPRGALDGTICRCFRYEVQISTTIGEVAIIRVDVFFFKQIILQIRSTIIPTAGQASATPFAGRLASLGTEVSGL